MQTIEQLNKKVLYRIVKVIYFGTLLFTIILIGSAVYNESFSDFYNTDKTRITCKSPNFYKDVSKKSYNISETLSDEQKQKIAREICGNTQTNIIESNPPYGGVFLSYNSVFIASSGISEDDFKYIHFFTYFLLGLLGAIVVFELIRRIFYYITFGTLKPQKKD